MHHKPAAALLVLLISAPVAWADADHDAHHVSPATETIGKVNAVDAGKRTINLTHGPIPALGWSAMTMDFGVASGVDLTVVKPGDAVAFTVGKDAGGVYQIDTLKPAN